MTTKLLTLAEVLERTTLKRSALYVRIQAGEFPKGIKLGKDARMARWLESDIDTWIDELVAAQRGES